MSRLEHELTTPNMLDHCPLRIPAESSQMKPIMSLVSPTEKLSGRKLNVAEVTQSEIGQKQKLQTVLEAVNELLRPHGWTIEWSVDCECQTSEDRLHRLHLLRDRGPWPRLTDLPPQLSIQRTWWPSFICWLPWRCTSRPPLGCPSTCPCKWWSSRQGSFFYQSLTRHRMVFK